MAVECIAVCNVNCRTRRFSQPGLRIPTA